jgi:hypothetical protein
MGLSGCWRHQVYGVSVLLVPYPSTAPLIIQTHTLYVSAIGR